MNNNARQFVVLMTDFGLKSSYVAQMKGVMLDINPNIEFIDLTHGIHPQNIKEAAFVVKGSYKFFPKNTIFLCIIDPEVGTERNIIILKTNDYYFIAPDNGLLTLVLETEKDREIYSVENSDYFSKKVSPTFHGRDIFAPVAAYLSLGTDIGKFGTKIKKTRKIMVEKLIIEENKNEVQGEVIYIDRFGNAVTSISGKYLRDKKVDFGNIEIKFKGYYIMGISRSYADKGERELLATVGSNDYLEIAINKGNAEEECGIKTGDKVRLLFGKY